jgi:uncharacterized protein (DUF488 family)
MSDKSGRKPRLFTIGHSDRSIEQFLHLLELSSIRLVADVRSNPASARYPHFERAALASVLEKRGVVYRWFRELGGRKPTSGAEAEHTALADEEQRRYAAAMNTPRFQEACADLNGVAASTVCGVLCAERDYLRCHRRLLSDKLHVMGSEVVHIDDADTAVLHSRHPDLVVDGDRLTYRKRQLDLLSD